MTRRERLEAKLEKRNAWAEKAKARSESRFTRASAAVEGIPFGQPILIGHHSEKRHRAALERCDNNMRKGMEESNLAGHHSSKAAGLEAQLDTSIFSDDENAIEALEARIAEHEAKRDRMKTINKLYKKGDAAGLLELGLDLENLKAKLAAAGPYWGSKPHLPYELTNLGARIRTDKERIEEIRRRQARAAEAEAAGGVSIKHSGDYAIVTFAEKPERAVLDALKAAGFAWSGGSWYGKSGNLPACVEALAYDARIV